MLDSAGTLGMASNLSIPMKPLD